MQRNTNMEKQCIVLMLFFSIAMAAHGQENWFPAKQIVTSLQLYVEDILTGPTPTTIPVASANSTSASPTFFGLVAVIDDPVRTGPTPDAEIVGRAQGFFAYASLEEQSFHMSFDLVFTSGEYNGSTLNLAGHNPYLRDHRELSIVGGTGTFRLARGFVGVRTVSADSATAFFEYNVTVFHY